MSIPLVKQLVKIIGLPQGKRGHEVFLRDYILLCSLVYIVPGGHRNDNWVSFDKIRKKKLRLNDKKIQVKIINNIDRQFHISKLKMNKISLLLTILCQNF